MTDEVFLVTTLWRNPQVRLPAGNTVPIQLGHGAIGVCMVYPTLIDALEAAEGDASAIQRLTVAGPPVRGEQ